MGRLALCMAGLLLAWVVAEAQTYSPPPPSPTYSTPSPSSSLPKKQPPSPPPKKKQSPPPPPPKQHTPPPPPPKKRTPPLPPKKKQSPPPPPPKKHTPPPPPPKKRTPPPPSTYYSPPVVASPPPLPPTSTWPSPPPPATPTWPSPSPPPTAIPTPAWPSPPPTPTWSSPPPASAVAAKKVRCKSKAYPTCYFREFTCPADCPYTCEVDCHTCSPVCNCNKPGAICQDPRFIGADGLTFYFHGKKDQDFCLVTDSNLHINAHFIGKRNANMGRDFTWVQSLGILFDNHHIYIGARKTATWNDASDRLSLSFDGQPIDLIESEGSTWEYFSNGVTIRRSKATNAVEIEVENNFKIKAAVVPITEKESLVHNYGITPEDCFAHLDLSFKFYSLSGEVNGVLGQTYGRNYVSKVKMGISMPVVGGERKFSTSSLFATDCSVSRFIGENMINEEEDDNNDANTFGDLNCATGINGRGVVCKR